MLLIPLYNIRVCKPSQKFGAIIKELSHPSDNFKNWSPWPPSKEVHSFRDQNLTLYSVFHCFFSSFLTEPLKIIKIRLIMLITASAKKQKKINNIISKFFFFKPNCKPTTKLSCFDFSQSLYSLFLQINRNWIILTCTASYCQTYCFYYHCAKKS